MTRPAPTLVNTGAKPGGGSARCEWQSRQPRTPSTKYLPRANRSGVGSKWRSVSTRDFAPSTGLQPTVTVIKTASSEARAGKLGVELLLFTQSAEIKFNPTSCNSIEHANFDPG